MLRKKKIYKYFNNLRFLFSLWNFRQTRRKTRSRANEQTKQNKRRDKRRRDKRSCFFLLIDVPFGPLLRVPESQPAINCALLRIPLLLLRSSFRSCCVSKTNSKNDDAEGGGRAGLCAAGPGQHGEVHGQLAQAVSAKNRCHKLLQVATAIATELSQPCATEFKVSSFVDFARFILLHSFRCLTRFLSGALNLSNCLWSDCSSRERAQCPIKVLHSF